MRNKIIYIIISLILFQTFAFSQTQFSGWMASFNTVKINDKISVHSDIQLRSTEHWEQVSTLLLRTGINYHLNKKFIFTGGYAFIHNRRTISGVSGYADEHRIWEQVIFNNPLVLGSGVHARKGSFQHRLRLEQRFIPLPIVVNNELVNDGNRYANRLRYFIRTVNPFVPWKAKGNGVFLALQNEVFVNIGNASAVNGEFFDQNRAYMAIGYRFQSKFDLEVGYMNQYINGRGDVHTNNHIIQLATYLRL